MVPPKGGLKNKMSSNFCIDGTNNGYAVYEIQGSNVVSTINPPITNKSYQIRLLHGNGKFSGSHGYRSYGVGTGFIVANVFNYNPRWHVNVYEDGTYSGEMTSAQSYFRPDAWAVGYHLGVLNRDKKYFSKTCYHDFVYKLKNPKAKVRVEATDEYGNTYTQDTFTVDLASALH